ncbi:MAG TPA: zinc-ribbon domain-containing protein [Caulobacteraceae bacterium]|jgi:predicted Zn finger-like uncharacterized protein
MILTCPQCATRYFLPDGQVGREGRAVKCTTCGTVWRAEGAPEPEPEPEPELIVPSYHFEPEPEPEPPPGHDPEEEFAAAAQRRAEILRHKKAEAERRQKQQAVITGAVLAGVAAAIALCVALGIIFRIQLVKWWPGTATAYAALGMPVNASGLLIDKVKAAHAVVQGHPSLMVTGVLTNASAAPRPAPAFRVSILDKTGKPLAQRVIQTAPAVALKVGEARRFQLEAADPPAGAADVEVTLALPGGK